MNATQWRTELEELFQSLKTGKIKPPVATEMNNTMGKVIALTKLEMDYHRLCQLQGDKAPKIALLASSNK